MNLASWLRDEARHVAGWLAEGQLWVLLAVALLAWALAYQGPYRMRMAVGGDLEARTRRFDEPYLRGFNDSEPAGDSARQLEWWQVAAQPGAFPYRWFESESAIAIPGLGGGPWLLTLSATSGRQQPVEITLRLGNAVQRIAVAPGQPHRYSLALPKVAGGDLDLRISAPQLTGPGDPSARNLGFVVTGIELAALPTPWREPAWITLLTLGLTILLGYGLLRRLLIPQSLALGTAGVAALIIAGLLVRARPSLTIFAPTLPWLLLVCYALAVVGASLLQGTDPRPAQLRFAADARAATGAILLQGGNLRPARPRFAAHPLWRSGVTLRPQSVVVLIVVAGFVLRLGGMLHPHVIFSDLGLNVNNLRGTLQGVLFFSEGLPAEAGGGQAPYPPGQYLALAPLLLLTEADGDGIELAILAGNALLDSLLAALIWLALRRGGAGDRAACYGALFYLLPPPLLRSFGIGEFANIFGQALAMALLLGWLSRTQRSAQRFAGTLTPGQPVQPGRNLGAVFHHEDTKARSIQLATVFGQTVLGIGAALRPTQMSEPGWILVTASLILLALLGHLGVSISLACLLICLLAAWAGAGEGRRARDLALAGVVAAALALAIYYSAFGELLAGRLAAGATPSTPAAALADTLARLSRRVTRELRPGGVLYPPLVALGLLGLLRYGGLRPGLPALLSAWWLGTLLSLALLIFAQQGVRWEHFLYPGLCLGGGLTLGLIARRGRAGALAAALLLVNLVWYGGELWYNQLRAYLH